MVRIKRSFLWQPPFSLIRSFALPHQPNFRSRLITTHQKKAHKSKVTLSCVDHHGLIRWLENEQFRITSNSSAKRREKKSEKKQTLMTKRAWTLITTRARTLKRGVTLLAPLTSQSSHRAGFCYRFLLTYVTKNIALKDVSYWT